MKLDIARIGAAADGIAETPGGPIYVAGALPGEAITADVTGDRGRLVSVEQASADRIEPVCQHFGSCGGCAAQHMGGAIYATWKRRTVTAAFERLGLKVALDEMITVGAGKRRRATFTATRSPRGLVLGFHEEGTHNLVDLAMCPVVVPAIEAALLALRAISMAALQVGETLRIPVTAAQGGLDVQINGLERKPDTTAKAIIAREAQAAGILRVMADGDLIMQSALPRLMIGGGEIVLPPGAFIQATAEAETAIAAVLSDATRKAKRIADLFCGLGTFTFGLARKARVVAYDSDAAAIAGLITAAKAVPGIKPIETRVRDLMREPLSRSELVDIDAVVFDPPRAGAKAQAEAIARSKVPVVCAVSCNPSTLARDCRILVDAGFAIERVVPVDQFTWSPHIEAVVVLRRGKE